MQWLITGCSTGFGLDLAHAVLAQPGQKVIATSRNPAGTPEAVKQIESNSNGAWAKLDVSSATLESDLAAIVAKHGPIDVLINNAGYGIGGVIEATPLDTIRQQYEVNFFGAVRLIQAVVPSMRERGQGGSIVNVGSAAVWGPYAGAEVYASSKWALEGLSEALAAELAPLNIRVLIAQPGGMRTAFFDPAKVSGALAPFPDAYKNTMADYVLQALTKQHGTQALDPRKSAELTVHEVLHPTMVEAGEGNSSTPLVRLLLGKECIATMDAKIQKMNAEKEAVKDRASACDF